MSNQANKSKKYQMRNVIIVGTGGCASEITFYIEDNNSKVDSNEQINILGYLEYEENVSKYYENYPYKAPVLGDIDSYVPESDHEVLICVADVGFRKKAIDVLEKKKANIGSFIHSSSIVPTNADLGKGIILYPFCVIEDNAVIGDYNILTTYSFISHDCTIGSNNFLSTSGIAGHVKVGSNNYFGIRSTVVPGVEIGNRNVIQAGMIVNRNVKDDTTVFYRYKEQVLAIPK